MRREDILRIYEAGSDAVADFVQGLISEFTTVSELQTREMQKLTERIKTLENQLNQNSRNSSKPPSSDGFKKPKPKSLRIKGERKSGGQAGHKGNTLKFAETPDHVVIHHASVCPCGHHLEQESVLYHEKRQVYDLPPISIEVTEHQAEAKRCASCGNIVKASFPDDVSAPTQYGAGIRAVAVYLSQYQLLPCERVSETIEHLFQHKLSGGSLFNANLSLYQRLESVEQEIVKQITAATVAHFDETGMRVQGKTQWCHVASTDKLTHYHSHQNRGKKAMDTAGVLPNFRGTAVHDFWSPYFHYESNHAMCNAHILRELIFVLEEEKQRWAKTMIDLLLEIKAATAGKESLSVDTIAQFAARYDNVVELGYQEDAQINPLKPQLPGKRGKQKQSKPKNLLNRLRNHRLDVLRFLYDADVPFDNNQAERDVRMVKVKQKISGTFRSEMGAKVFCRIRGYISTARKHSCSILSAIEQALRGNPFLPLPLPSF